MSAPADDQAEATTGPCPSGPVRWTNVGSWPGTDQADATKIAFAECPDLAYLPELPARGVHAQLVGRTTAVLSGLAVDLQPAGWRLTDAPGREGRLARSTLREDLDVLEEVAQGYAGPFKIAFGGPWTAVASVERPRGDRVLADHGARREVGQSLAEGLGELLAELRRRLPDLELVLQLDEPLLPAVLRGSIRTASGFSRHRAVDLPEVSETLTGIVERVGALVGTPVPVAVHCCAPGLPVALMHGAGIRGLLLDLDQLTTGDWDQLGAAMSEGLWLGAGALPTTSTTAPSLGPDRVAERVLRRLDDLGLDPAVALQTVLTPACGLAGFTPASGVRALRTLRSAADIVTDRIAG